jgi:hypothetical protein
MSNINPRSNMSTHGVIDMENNDFEIPGTWSR